MYVDYLTRRLERAARVRGGGRACPRGSPFSYAIVRVVPDVERGERLNVGVVVFCRPLRLPRGAHGARRDARAGARARRSTSTTVRGHLDAIERIAAGDPDAGPIAALDTTARFHWLVAPSSTILQPSEVHTGLCGDPAGQLERLFDRLVV